MTRSLRCGRLSCSLSYGSQKSLGRLCTSWDTVGRCDIEAMQSKNRSWDGPILGSVVDGFNATVSTTEALGLTIAREGRTT